jgi:hypothetical protein
VVAKCPIETKCPRDDKVHMSTYTKCPWTSRPPEILLLVQHVDLNLRLRNNYMIPPGYHTRVLLRHEVCTRVFIQVFKLQKRGQGSQARGHLISSIELDVHGVGLLLRSPLKTQAAILPYRCRPLHLRLKWHQVCV